MVYKKVINDIVCYINVNDYNKKHISIIPKKNYVCKTCCNNIIQIKNDIYYYIDKNKIELHLFYSKECELWLVKGRYNFIFSSKDKMECINFIYICIDIFNTELDVIEITNQVLSEKEMDLYLNN